MEVRVNQYELDKFENTRWQQTTDHNGQQLQN